MAAPVAVYDDANSGITLSRTTLTNYVKRSIALLAPIYDAQLQSILQSRVLAMDESAYTR